MGGGRVACWFGQEPALHSSARFAVRHTLRAAELFPPQMDPVPVSAFCNAS